MKWFVGCLIVLCASCRPCLKPDLCLPDRFVEGDMVEQCGGDPVNLLEWWTQFNDPLLTQLIEQAVHENLDLRIALERICEARARFGVEFATLLPQIDAFIAVTRERNSQTLTESEFLGGTFNTIYQAGFDASWEIDLFGKNQAAVCAAKLDIRAAAENVRDVHITISSEVARIYFAIRGFQKKIKLTQHHIESEKEFVKITEERFEAGLTTGFDVDTAKALYESRVADLPVFEIQLQQAIYALAVLLGEIPEELNGTFCDFADFPCSEGRIPLGLPSELLCRRGDVRSAEYAMRAAGARVVAARSEFFPVLTLNGFYSYVSGFFKEWFTSGSRSWSITPALTLPIFHGGRIWSNILVQTSLQRQAVLAYEKSVLTALQEVESGLIAYFKEGARIQSLKRAVEANRDARNISEILYRAGKQDFLNVLISERDLYLSELELIESEQLLGTSLIAVYKALGGGWIGCCSMP